MYMYWDQPIDAHTDADLAMALDLATLIAADTDDFFTFYCAEAEWLRAEVVNALLERHMLPKPPKGTALKAKRRRKAQQTRREQQIMTAAKVRDGYRCRSCGQPGTDAAHLRHRGMGGNPAFNDEPSAADEPFTVMSQRDILRA